jgi:guanylate kinase
MTKLFVISAPSGAGKTSLINSLLEQSNNNLKLGISCTTRSRRKNEIEGKSYFFLDSEEFSKKIKKDEFLEYAEVFGNHYGTPKEWIISKLNQGLNVILELDWQGAKQVKDSYPDTSTVFILPPSYSHLQDRLKERGQDSSEEIKKRIGEAKKEILQGSTSDHLIVNDKFEDALHDLIQLILEEKELSLHRIEAAKNCINHLLAE